MIVTRWILIVLSKVGSSFLVFITAVSSCKRGRGTLRNLFYSDFSRGLESSLESGKLVFSLEETHRLVLLDFTPVWSKK